MFCSVETGWLPLPASHACQAWRLLVHCKQVGVVVVVVFSSPPLFFGPGRLNTPWNPSRVSSTSFCAATAASKKVCGKKGTKCATAPSDDRGRLDMVVYGATPSAAHSVAMQLPHIPLTQSGHSQTCVESVDGVVFRVASRRKRTACPELVRGPQPCWVWKLAVGGTSTLAAC